MNKIRTEPDIQPMSEFQQEKTELLQDIQTAITQINEGEGVNHADAKERILSNIRGQE